MKKFIILCPECRINERENNTMEVSNVYGNGWDYTICKVCDDCYNTYIKGLANFYKEQISNELPYAIKQKLTLKEPCQELDGIRKDIYIKYLKYFNFHWDIVEAKINYDVRKSENERKKTINKYSIVKKGIKDI